jgi:hypothetical protein
MIPDLEGLNWGDGPDPEGFDQKSQNHARGLWGSWAPQPVGALDRRFGPSGGRLG